MMRRPKARGPRSGRAKGGRSLSRLHCRREHDIGGAAKIVSGFRIRFADEKCGRQTVDLNGSVSTYSFIYRHNGWQPVRRQPAEVVLAKWRIAGVNILILDHPTRGIDVGAKEDADELIRDMTAGDLPSSSSAIRWRR